MWAIIIVIILQALCVAFSFAACYNPHRVVLHRIRHVTRLLLYRQVSFSLLFLDR